MTDQERRELPTEVRRNHEAIGRHNEELEEWRMPSAAARRAGQSR
jgi:hypothetical protein